MNILFYQFEPGKTHSTGMRTHVTEVLGNLHRMGHVIRYVDGRVYTPTTEKDDIQVDQEDRQKSLWARLANLAMVLPFKGEIWLFWNMLKEIWLFFVALVTVIRHRPDVIYRRYIHYNSDYFIARIFNIPLVKEANSMGSEELVLQKRGDKFTLWLYKMLERYKYPRADRIIVITPELKELIQTKYNIKSEKITVIQNGANTELFQPMNEANMREKLGLNQDAFYICFVGLLMKWQGIEYLLRSTPLILEKCPEAQILIVGDGPIKEELKTLAENIGISSKVKFTGRVAYQDVPSYINAADVCVAPFIRDLDRKGGLCSLKMHEYMACGKPVVISRLKGIEDMESKQRLISFEPENVTELAKAIVNLYQNSEMRQRISDNARKYILENQSWQKVSERVADVLYSSISEKMSMKKETIQGRS